MKRSVTVAKEFINLVDKKGKSLTLIQVLKLFYTAHGWMRALHERPLVRDRIEAWQYGPVIPSLHNRLRHFRSNPVKKGEDPLFYFFVRLLGNNIQLDKIEQLS